MLIKGFVSPQPNPTTINLISYKKGVTRRRKNINFDTPFLLDTFYKKEENYQTLKKSVGHCYQIWILKLNLPKN